MSKDENKNYNEKQDLDYQKKVEEYKIVYKELYDEAGKPLPKFNIDFKTIDKVIEAKIEYFEKRRRRTIYILSGALSALTIGFALLVYFFFSSTNITIPVGHNVESIRIDGNEIFFAPGSKVDIQVRNYNGAIRTSSNASEMFVKMLQPGHLIIETDSLIVTLNEGTLNMVARGPYQKVSVGSGPGATIRVINDPTAKEINVGSGNEFRYYSGEGQTLAIDNLSGLGGWRYGYFSYYKEPVGMVLDDIERSFRIRIHRDPTVNTQLVSGVFNMYDGIDQILRMVVPKPLKAVKLNDSTYNVVPPIIK
ncbi:MAG: DUF4974 domain-containing protein [Cyclobacteriaceae bacterium]